MITIWDKFDNDLLWNEIYWSCDSFFTWIDERVTQVSCRAQIADNMCIYDGLLSYFTAHKTTLLLLLHHNNLFFFCTDVFLVCHGICL